MTCMFAWLAAHRRHLLLSILGMAVLATGIFLPFFLLSQPPQLETLLPAQETIGFWTNATAADLEKGKTLFPGLSSLPSFTVPMDVAVINPAQGLQFWAATPSRKDDTKNFHGNALLGHLPLLLSAADNVTWLQQKELKLAAFPPYRALLAHTDAAVPRLYLRGGGALETGNGITMRLLRSLAPGKALASLAGSMDGASVLRLYGENWASPSSSIAASVALLTPSPDGIVSIGAPQDAWQKFLSSFPASDQQITQALLTGQIRPILGKDVSVQFDLLPLLANPATVQWKNVTNGTMLFLAQGSMDDAALRQQKLSRIAQSATAMQRGGLVENRQFDEHFSARVLTSTGGNLHMTESDVNGWHVESILHGSGGLQIATQGNRFMLTNLSAWLQQAMEAERPFAGSGVLLSLPAQAGRREAAGVLPVSLLGVNDNPLLRPALLPMQGTIRWSVAQEGKIVSIVTEKDERQ